MPSDDKDKIIATSNALIEMYKAGFLDAQKPKPRTKKDFEGDT